MTIITLIIITLIIITLIITTLIITTLLQPYHPHPSHLVSLTPPRLQRMQAGTALVASVTEVLFSAITRYLTVPLPSRRNAQLILDTVLLANSRDYPATLLPGVPLLPPNPELLRTVSLSGCDDADRHAQRRRRLRPTELSDETPLLA